MSAKNLLQFNARAFELLSAYLRDRTKIRQPSTSKRSDAIPGSPEKIELMALRAQAQTDLCRSDDPVMPINHAWIPTKEKNGRIVQKSLVNVVTQEVVRVVDDPDSAETTESGESVLEEDPTGWRHADAG